MKKVLMYNVKEFKSIKEIIEYSGKEFEEREAFVIKHKSGKDVTYEKITYERLSIELNSLGTALINKGYKNIKIATIRKK